MTPFLIIQSRHAFMHFGDKVVGVRIKNFEGDMDKVPLSVMD